MVCAVPARSLLAWPWRHALGVTGAVASASAATASFATASAVPASDGQGAGPVHPGKPCCILDLDHTVLHRTTFTQNPLAGLALYVGRETQEGTVTGTIMPDCADTIAALRESWNFVAVTARWGWLPRARANTETWLAAHGMSMPVYYAPRPYPQDADRAVFKKGVIEGIGRGGEHGPVLAGVGDRPSDMVAYTENGLHAIVITDALGEMSGSSDKHRGFLHETEATLREKDPGVSIEYIESTRDRTAWVAIRQRLAALAAQHADR